MKKNTFLGIAIVVIAVAAVTSTKTFAMVEAPAPTISICPGSPEACTGTVEVPGVGKVTVNSTKTKGGGTVVVS